MSEQVITFSNDEGSGVHTAAPALPDVNRRI